MKWKDKMERVLLTFRLFRKYGIKTKFKKTDPRVRYKDEC